MYCYNLILKSNSTKQIHSIGRFTNKKALDYARGDNWGKFQTPIEKGRIKEKKLRTLVS